MMSGAAYRLFILIAIIICVGVGCSPKKLEPFYSEPAKFNKTPKYNIKADLDKLPKPDKLKPIYIDDEFNLVSADKATRILLIPKEYKKIAELLKLCKAYKDVALEQEVLINTYISQINALKELLAMEQEKSKFYHDLWLSSENAYRQERHDHKVDNALGRISTYLMTIQSIVVLLLIL